MRRMGYETVVLMTAITIGCNRNDRTTPAANSGGEPSAVATSGTDRSNVSKADQDFVQDAAVANMAEIELGKIAIERATNPEVKRFGQMMIDDHTKAGDALKAMASQRSIPVPSALDDKHNDLRARLAKRSAGDFDREYIGAMVDGHQAFVDKLEWRVDRVKLAEWKEQMADRVAKTKVEERAEAIAVVPEKSDNPMTMSINQWAADTYPVAVAHLTAAKTINAGLKNRTTN